MSTSEEAAAATREPSLAQEWLRALRYHLGGRRSVIALAALAVVAGAALNWSWLVAAGIAPLLVAVLPCAVMCGLGLCLSRAIGGACSDQAGACSGTKDAADAAPEGARPEALPAAGADPNQLTLAVDGGAAARPAAAAPVAPAGVARAQASEGGGQDRCAGSEPPPVRAEAEGQPQTEEERTHA